MQNYNRTSINQVSKFPIELPILFLPELLKKLRNIGLSRVYIARTKPNRLGALLEKNPVRQNHILKLCAM